MGWAAFKGNVVKWKMKHHSDIAWQGMNTGAIDLWPTMLPVSSWRCPHHYHLNKSLQLHHPCCCHPSIPNALNTFWNWFLILSTASVCTWISDATPTGSNRLTCTAHIVTDVPMVNPTDNGELLHMWQIPYMGSSPVNGDILEKFFGIFQTWVEDHLGRYAWVPDS